MTSTDIYKAPEAELQSVENTPVIPYFIVSMKKLWVLSIVTMGSYLLLWNYFHWKTIKRVENSSIWPVPRSVFSLFFVSSLFKRFADSANKPEPRYAWSPSIYVVIYIIVSIISNVYSSVMNSLPNMPISLSIDFGMTVVCIVLITFVAVKAQVAANIACDDEEGKTNSSFTGVNIAWMVFFIILWIFYLLGTFFFPEEF